MQFFVIFGKKIRDDRFNKFRGNKLSRTSLSNDFASINFRERPKIREIRESFYPTISSY